MKLSNTLFLIFTLLFFSSLHIQAQVINNCGPTPPNTVLFDTSFMRCASVWRAQNYSLRYIQAGPNWSFILAAPYSNAYVGMGFSQTGDMIGSTAVVGWIAADGSANMRKYTLNGQTPQQVTTEPSDQGRIQVANTSIALENNVIFMAFQLVNTPVPSTRLVFSLGPQGILPGGADNRLTQHQDMTRSVLDYGTGSQSTIQGRPYASLRRTHGLLNMLGWAIFIPIGAMVARYMRRYDPIWFYAHTSIQTFGFLLGVSGVICGLVLEQRSSASVGRHKGIGIFILTLGCLQLIAFLARPDKASKVRKYWNWYHFGVGRLLILLAAINVYYGIHVGRAGAGWNAGFSVVLGIFLVITVVMELRMWFKKT